MPILYLSPNDGAYPLRIHKISLSACSGYGSDSMEISRPKLVISASTHTPCEAICCDDFYGQSGEFRARMNGAGHIYMADVPRDTRVYLKRPDAGVPEAQPGRCGRKPSRSRVLSEERPLKVCDVARQEDTNFCVRVRATERSGLNDEFAARCVWTIHEGKPVQEWLVMRRESDENCSYSRFNLALSN